MAAFSTMIAVAGLGLSAVGAYQQYSGMKEQQKTQSEIIGQQRNIEAERKKQMELDATRRRRELVRQMIAQQAQASAVMTAQGATGPGSSAVGGVYGSVMNQGQRQILGVNQNLEIGRNIFDANENIYQAQRRSASAGSDVAFGNMLSSFGGALVKNASVIGKVGGSFGSAPSYYYQGNYRVPMYS